MRLLSILLFCLFSFNIHAESDGSCVNEKLTGEIQAVFKKHMIYGLKANFDFCEIEKQSLMYENRVFFVEALDKALESFLNDETDLESPLFVAYVRFYDFTSYENVKEYVKDLLLFTINASDVRLNLVPHGRKPENGEDVTNNWRFHLSIDHLSDHLHWAIVDRIGKKKTYNYGFN